MPRKISAVLVLCASAALTQTDSPRSLSVVDIAATDLKGNPVTDLHDSEILVHEDGKPRPVVFFRFAGSRRQVAPPAAGEFVNRPEQPTTVILLDRWNEKFATSSISAEEVNRALSKRETVDRIFIYFLTNHGELFPVRALPALDAGIDPVDPPTPADLAAKLDNAVKSLSGLRDMANVDPAQRVNPTLEALGVFSRAAPLPGPKNLIWVTHGFPIQANDLSGQLLDFTPAVRDTSRSENQLQVALYTVDQSGQGAGADPSGLSRQTLETYASLTGGRWYPSGLADVAINGALNDARGRYRLAYSPSSGDQRKGAKLRFDCTRKNVRLLVRPGPPGVTGQAEEDFFSSESRSPFDAADILLRATVSRPAGAAAHFEIRLDPADLLLEHTGQESHGDLGLMFAFYRKGAFQSAAPVIRKNLVFTQDVAISQDVPVPAQIDQARIMVFDRASGGAGSVTLPMK